MPGRSSRSLTSFQRFAPTSDFSTSSSSAFLSASVVGHLDDLAAALAPGRPPARRPSGASRSRRRRRRRAQLPAPAAGPDRLVRDGRRRRTRRSRPPSRREEPYGAGWSASRGGCRPVDPGLLAGVGRRGRTGQTTATWAGRARHGAGRCSVGAGQPRARVPLDRDDPAGGVEPRARRASRPGRGTGPRAAGPSTSARRRGPPARRAPCPAPDGACTARRRAAARASAPVGGLRAVAPVAVLAERDPCAAWCRSSPPCASANGSTVCAHRFQGLLTTGLAPYAAERRPRAPACVRPACTSGRSASARPHCSWPGVAVPRTTSGKVCSLPPPRAAITASSWPGPRAGEQLLAVRREPQRASTSDLVGPRRGRRGRPPATCAAQ